VEMSPLTNSQNVGVSIQNQQSNPDDPNDYVGRRIEVFTQHYLYVPPELSTPPQWFYAPSAPPRQLTGWIPDALIPHNAAQGFGGQPVHVMENCNQGFWIDIYVPDEISLTAGLYTGTITISWRGGTEKLDLPVELDLFDFALPQETHT